MKKYSKPVVHADVINDINEPVLMAPIYPSGWNESDCWSSGVYQTQAWEQSRQYFVCQGDSYHDSNTLGVMDGHVNLDNKGPNDSIIYGQYCIFEFDKALPVTQYGITGHINHYPLEFYLEADGTAKRARAITNWHANATESVGMGNFEVHLTGVPADIQTISISEIMFADSGVNPYSGNAFRQH